MVPWRSTRVGLACVALAAGLTLSPTQDGAAGRRFDLATIQASRQALERLPAAIRDFEAGRYGAAEQAFAALLAALPASEEAATAAALLALPSPAAYRRLRSGVETNLGLSRLRSRRTVDALAPLTRAALTDPTSPRAWGNLGVGLLHARRPCEARAALERAVAVGASQRTALHLGRAALECGEPSAARRALARFERTKSPRGGSAARGDRLEAELLLARVEAEEGLLRPARARLERLLAATPDDPLPRYHLIQVLARLGESQAVVAHREVFARSAERMAAIQGALGERPEEVGGLHFIAQTYSDLGLDHLAQVHYQQLLARDPRDQEALWGLAELERRARHGSSP